MRCSIMTSKSSLNDGLVQQRVFPRSFNQRTHISPPNSSTISFSSTLALTRVAETLVSSCSAQKEQRLRATCGVSEYGSRSTYGTFFFHIFQERSNLLKVGCAHFVVFTFGLERHVLPPRGQRVNHQTDASSLEVIHPERIFTVSCDEFGHIFRGGDAQQKVEDHI